MQYDKLNGSMIFRVFHDSEFYIWCITDHIDLGDYVELNCDPITRSNGTSEHIRVGWDSLTVNQVIECEHDSILLYKGGV